MSLTKQLLLFNLTVELLLNCKFYLKFKRNRARVLLYNIIILISLYSIFSDNKLILLTYAVYNYIQVESRIVSISEYKLPFFFKLFNYIGCIYNIINLCIVLSY